MATVTGSASPNTLPSGYIPGSRLRHISGSSAFVRTSALYIYRSGAGVIATTTALPLPAGGVLLRIVYT